MKDIFPVAFSLPWTKLYSPVESVGNNQATLTVWNKMYNILQLDFPFFFLLSQGTKPFLNSSQGVQASNFFIKKAMTIGDFLWETAFRYKRNKWNYKLFTMYLLNILYTEILIWGQSMIHFFNIQDFIYLAHFKSKPADIMTLLCRVSPEVQTSSHPWNFPFFPFINTAFPYSDFFHLYWMELMVHSLLLSSSSGISPDFSGLVNTLPFRLQFYSLLGSCLEATLLSASTELKVFALPSLAVK